MRKEKRFVSILFLFDKSQYEFDRAVQETKSSSLREKVNEEENEEVFLSITALIVGVSISHLPTGIALWFRTACELGSERRSEGTS